MAARDKLTEALTSYEKPTLRFVNNKDETLTSLVFADLRETLEMREQIGLEVNGVKYLFILEKAAKKINELKSQRKSEDEIYEAIFADASLRTPMPKDYADFGYVSADKLIYSAGKFDPSKSVDKFRVELKVGPNDPAFKDKEFIEVEIETGQGLQKVRLNRLTNSLTKGEGYFYSEELLLVPNKRVDTNPKTHQTIVAGVGDRAEVSYRGKNGETYTAAAEVPIKKVLPLQFVILLDHDGKPMGTEKDVKKQIAFAQDGLNQTHTQMKNVGDVKYFQVPDSIDLKDGLDEAEMDSIVRLTSHYAPQPGIMVIIAKDIGLAQGRTPRDGRSFAKTEEPGSPAAHAVIIRPDSTPFTLAHELGHVIFKNGEHHDFPLHLMTQVVIKGDKNDIFHTAQYLSREDIDNFQKSDVLVDPPPPAPSITTGYRGGVSLSP
ncbi:MAG: hypothetical protein K1X66_06050 [Verrucomicrobiae bacterium]|nr:hypothetical protein [Verrucomicrobiae bacterium]